MPETERERFQEAWKRLAPEFYLKGKAPYPDTDLWMVRLAWKLWQERAKDA